MDWLGRRSPARWTRRQSAPQQRHHGRTITLYPGDVIATGTPVGVGIGFKPPRYLKSGDVVRVEIDGIGQLENPVR